MKKQKLNKYRKNFIKHLCGFKRQKSKYFSQKPALILLSGGASKRFGCDKMAYVNSKRVCPYAALAKRLISHCELYECAKFKRLLKAKFIRDEYADFAPANALKSIEASGVLDNYKQVFILAGDYFKATKASLRWLLMQAKKHPKTTVIYKSHMLYGLYQSEHLKRAKTLSTEARMRDFFLDYQFSKEFSARKKFLQNFNFNLSNSVFFKKPVEKINKSD